MSTIRKLEKTDIPICIDICKRCFAIEKYEYDIEKDLLSQFNNTSSIIIEFYVYEDKGVIKWVAGISNCLFDDGVFWLSTCYVDPQYQWLWIGKELVEYRIKKIKELWWEIIFSTTQKTRHLERFGFKKIESPYKTWNLMQLNLTA